MQGTPFGPHVVAAQARLCFYRKIGKCDQRALDIAAATPKTTVDRVLLVDAAAK
jgi:hypothetical protein